MSENKKYDISVSMGVQYDPSGAKKAQEGLDSLTREVVRLQERMKGTHSQKNKNLTGIEQKDIQKSINTIRQFDKVISSSMNTRGEVNFKKFNESLKATGKTYKDFQQQIYKTGPEASAAFDKITSSLMSQGNVVKKQNKVFQKLGQTFRNAVSWNVATLGINSFTGAMQTAVNYVKQLDESLNKIAIVTNKSSEYMRDFGYEATITAKELGKTTKEYTDASLIFFQQGLGEKDVKNLTETTLKLANVSGDSVQDAADKFTALINGYKVASEDAEKYADKVTAVASTTASSSSELMEAAQKVASTANALGISSDQMFSQIATIVSTTRQDASSVGTSLKTIYARINDLKVNPNSTKFGVSLGDVSGTLKQVGIEVLDAQGNLRDTGPLMEEIAAKWQGWTKAQKDAVAVAVAGKRQYNNLFALFENWDDYQTTLNTSMQSSGTLEQQQAKYMERLNTKLKELDTTWEQVINDILMDKDFGGLVDTLITLTEGIDDFVKAIGGGNGVLKVFVGLLGNIFSRQMGEGMSKMAYNAQQMWVNRGQKAENVFRGSLQGTDEFKSETLKAQEKYIFNRTFSNEEEREATTARVKEYTNAIEERLQKEEELKKLEEEEAQLETEINTLKKEYKDKKAAELNTETAEEKTKRVTAEIEEQKNKIAQAELEKVSAEMALMEKEREGELGQSEISDDILKELEEERQIKTEELELEREKLSKLQKELETVGDNPYTNPVLKSIYASYNANNQKGDFGEVGISLKGALTSAQNKIKDGMSPEQAVAVLQNSVGFKGFINKFNKVTGKDFDIYRAIYGEEGAAAIHERETDLGGYQEAKDTTKEDVKQAGKRESQARVGLDEEKKIADRAIKISDTVQGLSSGMMALTTSTAAVTSILDGNVMSGLMSLGMAVPSTVNAVKSLSLAFGTSAATMGGIMAGLMLLSITVNRIDESFKKEAENAEKQLQQRMEQINAVKDLEKEKKSYDDMIEEYEKTGIVTKELQSTYESLRAKLEEQGITVSTSGDAFKNCQTAVEDFSEKVKSAGTAALAAATARKKDDAEKGVLGQLIAKITGNTALSKFSGLNLGETTRKALQKRGATLSSSTTFQAGVGGATDIQGEYDYEQFKRINDTLVNGGSLVGSDDRAELQAIMDEYAEQTQIYKEKLIEDTNNILKEQSYGIKNSIDGIERSFDKLKQTATEKNLGLSEEALRERYFEILRKNKNLNEEYVNAYINSFDMEKALRSKISIASPNKFNTESITALSQSLAGRNISKDALQLLSQPEVDALANPNSEEFLKVLDTLTELSDIKTPFEELFNSKDFKTYKKELIDMFDNGEATEKAIKNNENYKKVLEDTGLTYTELVEKMKKYTDDVTQIEKLGNSIDPLRDILGQKGKEPGKGVDANYLSKLPETLKRCKEEYADFINVAGSAKSTQDEVKKSANKLLTAYFNSSSYIDTLTGKTKEWIAAQLDAQGVANSDEVAKKLKERAEAAKVADKAYKKTIESEKKLNNRVKNIKTAKEVQRGTVRETEFNEEKRKESLSVSIKNAQEKIKKAKATITRIESKTNDRKNLSREEQEEIKEREEEISKQESILVTLENERVIAEKEIAKQQEKLVKLGEDEKAVNEAKNNALNQQIKNIKTLTKEQRRYYAIKLLEKGIDNNNAKLLKTSLQGLVNKKELEEDITKLTDIQTKLEKNKTRLQEAQFWIKQFPTKKEREKALHTSAIMNNHTAAAAISNVDIILGENDKLTEEYKKIQKSLKKKIKAKTKVDVDIDEPDDEKKSSSKKSSSNLGQKKKATETEITLLNEEIDKYAQINALIERQSDLLDALGKKKSLYVGKKYTEASEQELNLLQKQNSALAQNIVISKNQQKTKVSNGKFKQSKFNKATTSRNKNIEKLLKKYNIEDFKIGSDGYIENDSKIFETLATKIKAKQKKENQRLKNLTKEEQKIYNKAKIKKGKNKGKYRKLTDKELKRADKLQKKRKELKKSMEAENKVYEKAQSYVEGYTNDVKEETDAIKELTDNISTMLETLVSSKKALLEYFNTWKEVFELSSEASKNFNEYYNTNKYGGLNEKGRKNLIVSLSKEQKVLTNNLNLALKARKNIRDILDNKDITKLDKKTQDYLTKNMTNSQKKAFEEAIKKNDFSAMSKTINDALAESDKEIINISNEIFEKNKQYIEDINNSFSKISDSYDRIVNNLKTLSSIQQKFLETNKILYGEKSFEYLNKQKEILANDLDTIQKTKDIRNEEIKKYEELIKQAKEKGVHDNELIDNETKLKELYADKAEIVQEELDTRTKIYENEKQLISLQTQNNLLGQGAFNTIEDINTYWGNIESVVTSYYDNVQRKYQQRNIDYEYKQLLEDNKDNAKITALITEQREIQLAYMEKMGKLTKQEVERQEALLELLKAQIALQNAQDNKNKLRLKRDSRGNYSYQYVADQNDILAKQKAVEDAQNKLWDIEKQGVIEAMKSPVSYLNSFMDSYNNFIDKGKFAEADVLAEQGTSKIASDMTAIKDTFYEIVTDRNKNGLTNTLIKAGLVKDRKELDSWSMKDFYDAIGKLDNNLIPHINGVADSMVESFMLSSESAEDFAKTIVGGYTKDLKKARKDEEEATESLNQILNEISNTLKKIIGDENSGLETTIKSLSTQITIASDAVSTFSTTLDNASTVVDKTYKSSGTELNNIGDGSGTNKNNTTTPSKSITPDLKHDDYADAKNKIKNYLTMYDKEPNKKKKKSIAKALTDYLKTQIKANKIPSLTELQTKATLGHGYDTDLLKAYKNMIDRGIELMQEKGFATGGYTGTWAGNEGRLAVLHQKELVLNSADTENLLKAIELMNLQMTLPSGNGRIKEILESRGANENKRNIIINADFPNVSSKEEIVSAFELIEKRASQYVNK